MFLYMYFIDYYMFKFNSYVILLQENCQNQFYLLLVQFISLVEQILKKYIFFGEDVYILFERGFLVFYIFNGFRVFKIYN